MATSHSSSNFDYGDNLEPMSGLHNFKIEPGDPDPRGWSVVSTDGSSYGTVRDLLVDTSAMKVRHLIVDVDRSAGAGSDSSSVLLDVNSIEIRPDTRQVLARDISAGRHLGTGTDTYASSEQSTFTGERTLTRAEEEVSVGKREVMRGEARVAKHVETEQVSTPVTRRHEELVVERRPVQEGMRADATISEEEVRIPLMEEEVVVEKRPVVKEELVVGKRMVEERDTVETEVRREEFDIDQNATTRRGRTPGER